jgi:hypothetical protein
VKVIDYFGSSDFENAETLEGTIFLKTKSDKFKSHWAVLRGNEFYCYRRQQDAKHRIMHCLMGIYIKDMDVETCPKTN